MQPGFGNHLDGDADAAEPGLDADGKDQKISADGGFDQNCDYAPIRGPRNTSKSGFQKKLL